MLNPTSECVRSNSNVLGAANARLAETRQATAVSVARRAAHFMMTPLGFLPRAVFARFQGWGATWTAVRDRSSPSCRSREACVRMPAVESAVCVLHHEFADP